MNDLRYPIGRFTMPPDVTVEVRQGLIQQVAEAPGALRAAVAGLDAKQLDTPYRDEGWMVAQVVHHLPDSHMNSYVRFKLALTETNPTIKPYDENAWAALADGCSTDPADISNSLTLFEALHGRWVPLLRTLTPARGALTFQHPERGPMTLDRALAIYAWHGRHHVAHITRLRERMGW